MIVDEPKDLVHDIDALDTEDQLAVVDYVEDIYKFYKSAEVYKYSFSVAVSPFSLRILADKCLLFLLIKNSSRPHDYMGSQVEINAEKREILADWLIEEHHKFKLRPETLYLTFNIIDRYLSMETIPRKELQLVGMSAMLIACKYEDIRAPEVVILKYIS